MNIWPDGDTVQAVMLIWSRRLLPLVIAAICGLAAVTAFGSSHRGSLTGKWNGYIAGPPGSGVKRQHMVIVVNANERGGSWKISARCHGLLTLESISNGYHHYRRKLAHGSNCAGGDIDCLKRIRANVYDSVTSHLGGEYDSNGTLRRVRPR